MTKNVRLIKCAHHNTHSVDLSFEFQTIDDELFHIELCYSCAAMVRGIVLQGMLNDALKAIPMATFRRVMR